MYRDARTAEGSCYQAQDAIDEFTTVAATINQSVVTQWSGIMNRLQFREGLDLAATGHCMTQASSAVKAMDDIVTAPAFDDADFVALSHVRAD